jgi:hypothetical protein
VDLLSVSDQRHGRASVPPGSLTLGVDQNSESKEKQKQYSIMPDIPSVCHVSKEDGKCE